MPVERAPRTRAAPIWPYIFTVTESPLVDRSATAVPSPSNPVVVLSAANNSAPRLIVPALRMSTAARTREQSLWHVLSFCHQKRGYDKTRVISNPVDDVRAVEPNTQPRSQ